MTRMDNYFDKLVPKQGKADTVAGEIVRAMVKIGYRWFNDGDKVDIDYGKETCNAPARFLMEKCPKEISDKVLGLWQHWGADNEYEKKLDDVMGMIADYLDKNPELQKTPNTDDMLDWFAPEDSEWGYEDDEEEYDEYEDEEEYEYEDEYDD